MGIGYYIGNIFSAILTVPVSLDVCNLFDSEYKLKCNREKKESIIFGCDERKVFLQLYE